MPRAFSEQERELIRQQLLEHGYRLFTSYGLRKTNVEEIARAVGISKGAFYGFYESKEALLMDVIEQAEIRLREEVLAVVSQPGPSPRARLYAVLHRAFDLFTEMPILQIFTGSDYDLLFRRIPAETLQEHLSNDLAFIQELIDRCRESGIPVQVRAENLVGLLYPLVLSILHEEDFGLQGYRNNLNALLEMVAAYSLGEIELEHAIIPELDLTELEQK
jgi:AcrR family transcriptional regulator